MRKKLLSLALALAFCLGLAAPASAAGTKKVVVDEEHGLKITMNEFLREETRSYAMSEDSGGGVGSFTICVVADNSTVTIEAMEGRKYLTQEEIQEQLKHGWWTYEEMKKYAWPSRDVYHWVGDDGIDWHPSPGYDPPMTGPVTETVSPSNFNIFSSHDLLWVCESDFAQMTPATLQTSDWAKAEVEKAYDAGLMPVSPYEVDCTRGMTREEFAGTTVYLYCAMIGEDYWELDVDTEHPFTDVDEETDYEDEIGTAYNLGFVKGKGDTVFDPEGTLTRQEAAVMLGRVYAKVHGAIPKVANTAFADDKDVADWAKSEVAFMSGKEVVKGKGDNMFAPKDTLAIQEAVIMANRMLENLK